MAIAKIGLILTVNKKKQMMKKIKNLTSKT